MINAGFAERAGQSGARPAYVVKIRARHCGLTFSQSPCPATGVPCFNTLATCPVLPSYEESGRDYYFSEPGTAIKPGSGFVPFPLLDGPVSFSPGELDVTGGIGARSSCSFSLSDGPHHDIGIDPYVDTRPYDPMEQGTFWGKWLARNRFYTGSAVTIYVGHIDDDGTFDLDAAEKFAFVLERINGPKNKVSMQCKDPLKLADNGRALYPEPSAGELMTDIDDSATEFATNSLTVGYLDAYPDTGKVRIGDEIIRYSRDGALFTVIDETGTQSNAGRGIDGTVASDHRADSTVQLVVDIAPATAPHILEFLLTEIAGVDPAFVPTALWAQVQPSIGFLFSTQISSPEGVTDLINQLLKSAGVFMWWNDRQQRIDIRAMEATPPIDTLDLVGAGRYIADSFSIAREEERRLSRVIYYRGLLNSTEDLDDVVNYSTTLIQADSEREFLYGSKRIQDVFGRWTPTISAAVSWIVSGRTLSRYRDTPRKIKFALDNSQARYWVGDILAVRDRDGQNPDGSEETIPIQITRASFSGYAQVIYEALEYQVQETDPFPGGSTIIIDQDARDVRLIELYETTIGPVVENEPAVVNVLVTENARVEGFPAIQGGFPQGWSVNLINNGLIGGRGGSGGTGGNAVAESDGTTSVSPGLPGGNGGDALEMHENWRVVNNGEINGGAGGGGGGGAVAVTNISLSGGGGGGGQSLIRSIGGAAGVAIGPGAQQGSAGGDGVQLSPGAGGDGAQQRDRLAGAGGEGGTWAEPGLIGAIGTSNDGQFSFGGLGGSPGQAVKTNGFDLDLTDNGTIRGAVV